MTFMKLKTSDKCFVNSMIKSFRNGLSRYKNITESLFDMIIIRYGMNPPPWLPGLITVVEETVKKGNYRQCFYDILCHCYMNENCLSRDLDIIESVNRAMKNYIKHKHPDLEELLRRIARKEI